MPLRILATLVSTIQLTVVVQVAVADTWHVNAEGTGDFPTLFAACEAAANGDTILVAPGQYDESGTRIVLEDKGVTIIGGGENPDDTILSIGFRYQDSWVSRLENLSIRNSSQPIRGQGSSLLMRECTFRNNRNTTNYEAPVSLDGSDVVVEDCVFCGNYTLKGNGGALGGGSFTIRRSLFVDNESGYEGGAIWVVGHSTIEDCVFFRNIAPTGAAMTIRGHGPVRRCTLLANEVTNPDGAAIYISLGYYGWISECVIAGTVNGYGLDCGWVGVNLSCCNVWGNERGSSLGWCGLFTEWGNFSADPLFCVPETGDVGLLPGSPCLPGNHGGYECGLIGAKDLGCGEVPVRMITWGGIKALYR